MSIKLTRIENLKRFAMSRGLQGPKEIGDAIGRKVNQVSNMLHGQTSFGEKLARDIEAVAGLPEFWLDQVHLSGSARSSASASATLSVVPSTNPAPSRARADDIVINHFNTGGSMGGGLVLRDQPGVIQSWRVSPEWIAKNVKTYSAAKNLCIVTGFGDSMRPLYNPGDPLLVDTGVNTVDFEGVYFFRVGDEGYVKRLQRIPGQGLLVISDNTKYRDWTITSGMDFQVFGRVIKVWSGEEL